MQVKNPYPTTSIKYACNKSQPNPVHKIDEKPSAVPPEALDHALLVASGQGVGTHSDVQALELGEVHEQRQLCTGVGGGGGGSLVTGRDMSSVNCALGGVKHWYSLEVGVP